MSEHQSIERLEREFKDLLQKVMQAPLSPLADSVQELKQRMVQLEETASDMRDIVLMALSQGAENTRKQIGSLKIALSEETPREVHNVMQPLFERLQAQLEQGAQQRISQLAADVAGQLKDVERQAAIRAAGLKDVIVANLGVIEMSQKQGFEHLENLQLTIRTQLQTECESLRGEVGSQLAEQSADGRHAIERVQALLSLHRQEFRQQSASGLRQLADEADARMLQLTQLMTQLQTLLSAQQQQLDCLQQQQAACSELLGEQMRQELLPLKKWVIASVCVAATSLASVLALVAGRL